MPQYFFILGRNPELSTAELHAALPPDYRVLGHSREVLLVECAELNAEALMRRLGGTIKIGTIHTIRHFDQATPDPVGGSAWRNLTPSMLQVVRSLDGVYPDRSIGARDDAPRQKFFLGLSAYALDDHARLPSVRELRAQGIEVKRALQAKGHKVRLVTSKEVTLSSVIVKKEKLLSQGAEVVLIYGGPTSGGPEVGPQYIGKTLAVQEFEEASVRDFGRPVREMKVGMLPIQLAKIMINLARVPIPGDPISGSPEIGSPNIPTILDPFCGFGTILAEASLMGYRNLIGSDLEQKMVDATRKNIAWLLSYLPRTELVLVRGSHELENSNVRVFVSPVELLSKHLPPHSVDAIVTEPYLGPTRHGTWNMEHGTQKLAALYISAFREFAKILKPGGRVVFIFPAFKHGNTVTKTSVMVLPQIKKLGFEPIKLLPQNSTFFILPSPFSITYSRPSQHVLREIFVFSYR